MDSVRYKLFLIAKFSHAFYPEKKQFLSSEIPLRTHIIFLTWSLSLILQKHFFAEFSRSNQNTLTSAVEM